ncbi:site-specific DNA-methyltransferase, partial [Escherichia coli]|nr:site-specific DNA-methyltransferase [Escherichia coli]ELO3444929.1 site-specific DNA-methyltransferase [Escherichia coli]
WLDQCLAQFWRVLKPAGSLYLFCGHRLASDIEIMMRERFSVLSHIIWAKPSGRWNGCNKESLRTYFPATERILFAEHYQGPYRPKDAGYEAKGRALKQHVMAPLIAYFRDARAALGITAKQIVDATGKKNMVSHWFSASQWQLPDESDYLKLQALFARVAEEKHQRRYFGVTAQVPYTDVWTHKPVQYYPGKHPCEKPAEMLQQIISASSRPGDLVADFFMGSGSTVKAAMALGRRATGVELETERFEQTVREVQDLVSQNG